MSKRLTATCEPVGISSSPEFSLNRLAAEGVPPPFLLFKTPRFTADTGSTFAFWTLLNLIESNCYLIVYKITIVKKQ